MKSPLFAPGLLAAVLLLVASPISAQQPDHVWSHGTTLSMDVGTASASDDTGMALGGTIGWEITPRMGIDASASWLDRDPGASGFAASLTVHDTFTKAALSPYIEGGFGMYIATFDPNKTTNIPSFYANRMSGSLTSTFTDPAFFVNAGFDVFRSRHLSIRPGLGAMVVVDGGRGYTVGMFSVQTEYHFEEHPPSGR